jgi:hypothetical protein
MILHLPLILSYHLPRQTDASMGAALPPLTDILHLDVD